MSAKPENQSVNARRSFKTLQRAATDKENLAGRPAPAKCFKEQLLSQTQTPKTETEVKPKKSKKTQASFSNLVTEEDLTTEGEPSENYWKKLAEKRQEALKETLEENEGLWSKIEELEAELERYKKMLEEANCFLEVFQEMANENDDTGIDVGDVSTADESQDDREPKASSSKD